MSVRDGIFQIYHPQLPHLSHSRKVSVCEAFESVAKYTHIFEGGVLFSLGRGRACREVRVNR